MITNYDADAVAEVMGIAFLRDAGTAAVPVGAAKAPRPPAGKFVLPTDHGQVWVVRSEPGNRLVQFGKTRMGSAALKAAWRSSASPVLIEKAVENGLPRPVLRHLAEELAGDDHARVPALEWAVVPRTTLERREEQLSPQESERTERVARLLVHARRALGSKVEAREFMTTPHPQLDGRSPLEAARTDLGARRVEQILNALEYGLAL